MASSISVYLEEKRLFYPLLLLSFVLIKYHSLDPFPAYHFQFWTSWRFTWFSDSKHPIEWYSVLRIEVSIIIKYT
ncbi:hypothetical protein V1477_020885 [Vespula maculifrons]|uniref:Uncharacterized protein n=1 Tax=Vespula maculifrons TaxID=7453 RepID=A0ABD2AQ99_VESMC